jgi:hypothetical protein
MFPACVVVWREVGAAYNLASLSLAHRTTV